MRDRIDADSTTDAAMLPEAFEAKAETIARVLLKPSARSSADRRSAVG